MPYNQTNAQLKQMLRCVFYHVSELISALIQECNVHNFQFTTHKVLQENTIDPITS